MNIGNQIKALRLRRGVTQEAMAQHFGITSQAVSKWECGTSVPDIAMLPDLSAYFGVSIDELFALSDEVRMDRIQNMLWDVRFLNPADADNERNFLLEMGRREPKNADPYCMLAQLELHLAREHRNRAQEYALEACNRELACCCLTYLAKSMEGSRIDLRFNKHNALIAYYKEILEQNPGDVDTYAYLIQQLIDDHRLTEARAYCQQMAEVAEGYYLTVHQIKVALAYREMDKARQLWEQMGRDYPDKWQVWEWIGDFQTMAEDYAGAKESYRKTIELEPIPHYVDAIDSLAQVCEMDGDIAGAIAAREYELEVSVNEWGDSTGETIDCIHREIARLKKLL